MLRKIVRKIVYSLPVSLRIKILKKVSLLYYKAGLGDTLLIAAVAREIKQQYGNHIKVTVNTEKHELLENNPNINTLGFRYDGIDLNYHYGSLRKNSKFNSNLLDIMCKKVGIKNPDHTVNLFLTEKDIKKAKEKIRDLKTPFVTIQTTSGPFDAERKLWKEEMWINLVKQLLIQKVRIIHLGNKTELQIPGTINLLGETSIRESAAIIKLAKCHVGIVSSLMHVAEAVSTPSVIIFGGFEKFKAHGYKNVIPLESEIHCAPCGTANTEITPCPKDKECMNEITSMQVLEKVNSILSPDKVHG